MIYNRRKTTKRLAALIVKKSGVKNPLPQVASPIVSFRELRGCYLLFHLYSYTPSFPVVDGLNDITNIASLFLLP